MNRFARTLSPESYDTACDLAGVALLRRVPAGATLLQVTEEKVWSQFSAAVYIAADFENVIRYVGSSFRVRPPRDGHRPQDVGDRVQEHVRTGRAARWTRLMVVPLAADTDPRLVRRIEGRVGAVLRPLDTERLPTINMHRRRPASPRTSR